MNLWSCATALCSWEYDFPNDNVTPQLTLYWEKEVFCIAFLFSALKLLAWSWKHQNENLEDMTSSELWEGERGGGARGDSAIDDLLSTEDSATLWLGHFKSGQYNIQSSAQLLRPPVVPTTHSCFASGVKMRNSSEILAKAQLLLQPCMTSAFPSFPSSWGFTAEIARIPLSFVAPLCSVCLAGKASLAHCGFWQCGGDSRTASAPGSTFATQPLDPNPQLLLSC